MARLGKDIGDRMAAFARAAPARYAGTLAEVVNSVPRRELTARLYAAIESAVEESSEEFRLVESAGAEAAWHDIATTFRQRTQQRVDAVRATAGDLFSVALPPLVVPAVAEERERFFYLFLHIGLPPEPFSGVLGRLLPTRFARRRAARWASAELAHEFDKHAGRARWDLTQRLDAVRRRFEVAMAAELDASVEAIADATRRARALQQGAAEERDRRVLEARDQENLAHELIALTGTAP